MQAVHIELVIDSDKEILPVAEAWLKKVEIVEGYAGGIYRFLYLWFDLYHSRIGLPKVSHNNTSLSIDRTKQIYTRFLRYSGLYYFLLMIIQSLYWGFEIVGC